MILYPSGKFFADVLAACQFQHQFFLLVNGCVDFLAVEHQERFHCRVCYTFISVKEGMALDKRESKGCCLLFQ